MKRSLQLSHTILPFILLLLLPAAIPLSAQSQDDPAGHWEGRIEVPGQPLDVKVDIRRDSGTWKGTIDIPKQGVTGLELVAFMVEKEKVAFSIANIPGKPRFNGTIDAAGTTLAGTFTQSGAGFPFKLTRPSESQKAATAASTASVLDSLRTFIPAAMSDFKVPGLAIAIVRNGEVIFSEGFGYRDVEKKLPVTPNTLFAIGSSTKAFTAFVIGTLVDEGKLDWTTPVTNYLPTFKLKDECATEHITPRDLLTHVSGLPRHDMMWYNSSFTRKEIFDRLQYLEPSAEFRAQWQYQNMMYMTAGYLAGEVAGTTWEDLVRTRIFAPLGMISSNMSVTGLESAADAALGYGEKEKDGKKVVERLPYRNIDQIGPAGSINSNVVDMARWVKLQLDEGKYEGKEVIMPATLKSLHRPRVVISDGGDKETLFMLYAMGWMVQAYRGHRLVHHGGNIDGFSALVSFMPDDETGMVILTNANASPLPNVLMNTAYDMLLDFERTDWRGKAGTQIASGDSLGTELEKMQDVARVPGTRPSHKLDDYTGEYENEGYGVVKVVEERDRLKATYNGIETELEHFHYDVFRISAPAEFKGMKFIFRTGLGGEIESVSALLEPTVDDIVFKRRGAALDSAGLALYAGDYILSGITATVAIRGKALTLRVPGQPVAELIPFREHEFRLKGAESYRARFTIEKGRATELTLIQPNGTFVAKRVSGK
jgi:CubicO group peptidase (beta-lactamase class C family)